MGFEDFLPNEFEKEIKERELSEIEKIETRQSEKIGQEQFYEVITGKQPDWQTIIYDLINSEQLDPWDIDIIILTKKYFEKIMELEEQDFYISSKVLLAAALLLRIKSEFLLNKHIKSIDEVLFGRKDDKKYVIEKIQINEDELPLLIPKTPLPRARRITLMELMNALNKAISTESRRIRKEVELKRARKLSEIDFPTFMKIDLKDRIKQFYAKILTNIKKSSTSSEIEFNKAAYSGLVGIERDEKLACFLPLLHLSNTKKLWLEQGNHLDEIWIFLYEYFDKNRDRFYEEVEANEKHLQNNNKETNAFHLEMEEIAEEINSEINDEEKSENLDYKEDGLTKAKKMRERKNELAEEARKELERELNIEIREEVVNVYKDQLLEDLDKIEKEKKIDESTGFDSE